MNQLTMFDANVYREFCDDGQVQEVRFIKAVGKIPYTNDSARGVTVSGYFDNHADFCKHVRAALNSLTYDGCFFTLQRIDPRLLARAANRFKIATHTTADHDVLWYDWLPLDTDPVRPAGIPSSDFELKQALALRDKVAEWVMENLKFTAPIRAMSGNGAHLLFRLPGMPVNHETIAFVKNTLIGLADRFDTDDVKIDRVVFNPSRIWKLYGSYARKGDDLPAGPGREARPHRMAYIESLGGI